jgi:hypothetical protein
MAQDLTRAGMQLAGLMASGGRRADSAEIDNWTAHAPAASPAKKWDGVDRRRNVPKGAHLPAHFGDSGERRLGGVPPTDNVLADRCWPRDDHDAAGRWTTTVIMLAVGCLVVTILAATVWPAFATWIRSAAAMLAVFG